MAEPVLTNSFLFGPPDAAFRYAADAWRSLPSPNAVQIGESTKAFEAAFGGPLPGEFDPTTATLRRPHFTACFNGIFGGGTTGFPGEFALARNGVLLFADILHFKREILVELARMLGTPPDEGFPIVLIHVARAADLPGVLATIPLPRYEIC